MTDRPARHPISRVASVLGAFALVEGILYLVLYRSDTLHDLFRTPALIVAVVGVLVAANALRGRTHGDRRRADGRRQARRRDEGAAARAAAPAAAAAASAAAARVAAPGGLPDAARAPLAPASDSR